MILTLDRLTKTVLTVIAVMLTFIAVGLWMGVPSMTTPAYAGIPDSGLQLQSILDSVEKIEAQTKKMSDLLVSGKVKVQVVEATPAKAPKGTAPRPQKGQPGQP